MRAGEGKEREEAGAHAPVEHVVTTDRTARVYTLGALGAPDAWVVLHGYGQRAERFISQFAAIAGDERAVVAPEALNRFYLDPPRPGGPPAAERRVGGTWMTRDARELEIADYVAYLDRVATLVSHATRLTVLGFSQGVATAARWAALGTAPVQRLILWSGLVPPDLELGRLAERMDDRPIEIVLGDRDDITRADTLDGSLAALRESGVQHQLIRFAGGHVIDSGVLARLAANA